MNTTRSLIFACLFNEKITRNNDYLERSQGCIWQELLKRSMTAIFFLCCHGNQLVIDINAHALLLYLTTRWIPNTAWYSLSHAAAINNNYLQAAVLRMGREVNLA